MLQILFDNQCDDRGAFLFMCALKKKCEKHDVECKVVTNDYEFDTALPYVIIEPCNWAKESKIIFDPKLNCDDDATAKVIVHKINRGGSDEVLVIGRGKVVGKPLINELLANTNHQLTIVNSHIGMKALCEKIEKADIIINTSTSVIRYDGPGIEGKTILDANDNFKYDNQYQVLHLGMKEIGDLTTRRIVNNAMLIMDNMEDKKDVIE